MLKDELPRSGLPRRTSSKRSEVRGVLSDVHASCTISVSRTVSVWQTFAKLIGFLFFQAPMTRMITPMLSVHCLAETAIHHKFSIHLNISSPRMGRKTINAGVSYRVPCHFQVARLITSTTLFRLFLRHRSLFPSEHVCACCFVVDDSRLCFNGGGLASEGRP